LLHISSWWKPLDLNQLYIPHSSKFIMGRQRNTKYTKYGFAYCKYRRGDAAGAAPGWPFNSINTPSYLAPWWRGSSSLDYGIVEVTCIKLSLVLWWLESHELPIMIVNIFVLSLWWIFCLWDDLWDAKMFFTDVWSDVYVTWYVQNVSTFPNTFAIVSPLICVFWIQLTRTDAVFSRIALVSRFCAEI
jgi:hypothetical protein